MSNKSKRRIPKLENCNGRGRVYLNRRYHYLGPFGSPETTQAYGRLISEWSAHNELLPVPQTKITMGELCRDYFFHCREYYQHTDGSPTSQLSLIKPACRPLLKLYSRTPVNDFGPLALRTIREGWVQQDLARETINKYTGIIRNMFKWGVSHERIPVEAYQRIKSVENLAYGRSKARETEPIRPVPEQHIQAIRPHVPETIWSLIQLQLLTGARAGELFSLRPSDIDTTDEVWTATLAEHKTTYRGKKRVLYFGPRAKSILRERMADTPIHEQMFSPRQAIHERSADSHTHRRAGQSPTPRVTARTVGHHYTKDSYRVAIRRACDKAGVPTWTPHRLRHNAATFIRREHGLEAAQVILGHSRADVTQLYAEVDEAKAIKVIREIG